MAYLGKYIQDIFKKYQLNQDLFNFILNITAITEFIILKNNEIEI